MRMHLNDGESYIKGRSPEKAEQLLQAARDAGLEGSVRTTSFGYIVPEQLAGENTTTTTTGRKLAKPSSSLDEAQAVVADRPSDTETSESTGPQFDPSHHTVDEVTAYLDSASAEEHQRVLDEEAAGKNRTTITSHTHTGAEGAK